ncbi:MAG: hypothetical protein V3R57_04780 [Candidatus Bathyarchaeia archaeon]
MFECIDCVESFTPGVNIFIDLVKGMAASTKNNVPLFKTTQLQEFQHALTDLTTIIKKELKNRRGGNGDY